MKPILKIRRMWCVSYRFKSKTSKVEEKNVIKRLNIENKLMYGKLLESSKAKAKRLASEQYFENLSKAPSRGTVRSKVQVGRKREPVKLQTANSSTESDTPKILEKDTRVLNENDLQKNENRLDNKMTKLEINTSKTVDGKSAKRNNQAEKRTKENVISSRNAISGKKTSRRDRSNVELSKGDVHCKLIGEEERVGDSTADSKDTVRCEGYSQTFDSAVVESNEKIEDSEDSRMSEEASILQQNNDTDLSSPCSSSSNAETSVIDDEKGEYVSPNNDPIGESILTFPLFNERKKNKYSQLEVYDLSAIKVPSNCSYPTVSVILRETMSETSEWNLRRWKESVIAEQGAEEFESFQKLQLLLGSEFRQQILKRLKGTPEEKLVIDSKMKPYWNSLKKVFPLISDIKAVGTPAVHSELKYKGAVDCLAEFQSTLMLVNWKKSRRVVPALENAFDMPIQIAAYVGAINYDDKYPFRIEDALLVICYVDGSKADILHMNAETCSHYWNLWLKRLHKYEMRLKDAVPPKIRTPPKINVENDWKILKRKLDEQKSADVTCTSGKDTNLKQTDDVMNTGESSSNNIFPSVTSAFFTSSEDSKKMLIDESEYESKSILQFPLLNDAKKDNITSEQVEKYPVNELFASCPAVTSILNESRSDSAKFLLERWKRNLIAELGEEGFQKYQTKLLQDGSNFHKLVQDYLNGVPERLLDIKSELYGCWCSLRPVFPLISKVKLTERKVVHEGLKYKGIVDCVAEFQNKLLVIDWKKSDKIKSTINMTYDAPIQVAAYIGAINYDSCFPFKIKEGLLVISYTDGSKADIFYINEENCLKYWKLWLERLNRYQNLSQKNSLKIVY